MAAVLKLRRDSTDLSFLNSSGLYLRERGWKPQVATPVYGRRPSVVEEVLDMDVIGSSHDNVGATMQALDEMRRLADEYMRDRTQEHPVWLHAKLDGETGERRALARRVGVQWLSEHYSGEMVGYHPAVRVAIEREGVWERTACELSYSTPAAAASVTFDYTAAVSGFLAHDIIGDLSSRIGLLEIGPSTNDELGQLWIGLRSANKHGTLSNFVNVWECEDTDATLGTNAARADDNTASPGENGAADNKVIITPGTATWAKRLSIELGDVTSNESDNFGDFLWLLRAKVSAGTWEIQLRFGYTTMSDDDFIRGAIIETVATSWDYLEMGWQPIPLRDIQVYPTAIIQDSYETSFQIQIWARRTSGSGTLDLDCLCPVPLDEGWITSWDLNLSGAGGAFARWRFAESPTGQKQVVCTSDVDIQSFSPFATDNFRLPIGDGRMIIVYARASSSILADRIQLNTAQYSRHYEQWLSLRGAE